MHHGRIVEAGPAAEVYRSPQDPYTRALIDAAPLPDPAAGRLRRARTAATRVESQR
jgi:ABC-type oligopeptide transport system ATPase subunit